MAEAQTNIIDHSVFGLKDVSIVDNSYCRGLPRLYCWIYYNMISNTIIAERSEAAVVVVVIE
jgi:hypothetical protein